MTCNHPRAEWSFILDGLEETESLGLELARAVRTPGLAAFFGGLGSGKTTLIQALGRGLGITDPITSPTYTIVNRYEGGRLPLVHVDCYRVESPEELQDLGLTEIFSGPHLVCMEWSEHAAGLLPGDRMEVHLAWLDPERRGVRLAIFGNLWPEADRPVALWLERNAAR
jgi:tRNA threonylcarbamoyladenosine biosynthesis protein TsaE